MSFKSSIKELAFKNHILMERLNSSEQVSNFLKRFREKENRETLYYLIPDLDYMFLKIIGS